MANLKVVDGRVAYMLKTYDGSYVSGSMSAAEAETYCVLEDKSIPGYELVHGNYHFQTEEVLLKLKSKKQGD